MGLDRPGPVCDEHGRGLHTGYCGGTAVWVCTAGSPPGHVVRTVDPAVQLS